MFVRTGPLALAAVLALAADAPAALIPLFNTGVDAVGTPLAGGSNDPHWTVVSGPGVPPTAPGVVLTNQNNPPYFVSPVSRWVWRNASGSAGPNTFTFRQTFDLTGFIPASASITGAWGVDNTGSIFLNGSNVGIGSGTLTLTGFTSANFTAAHTFLLNSGFVAGINTLDFVVTDADNKAGLNVTRLVGEVKPAGVVVPEPASVGLLAAGVVGLAGWARRRGGRS